MSALLPMLLTALFAGLLGSAHCFGMCGGIAGGLGTLARRQPLAALAFNAGRLTAYTLLGASAGLLLGGVGTALELPAWGRGLRLVAALLIALVGLQMLSGWRVLDVLERAGGRVWARVAPLAARLASHPGLPGRLALGLCWGLLPCGLVYTMLLAAGATGRPTAGALLMLVFGLGTLPSMLGMTLMAPALSAFLGEPWTRRLVGIGLLLLAAWSLVLALSVTPAHH